MIVEYENLKKSNAPFMAEVQAAVNRVVASGWYILGEEVTQFENAFANYLGMPTVVGVASGLDALILSLEALELPEGSGVLVPANTYIATILAILRAGLKPVLVDPGRDYNITLEGLQKNWNASISAVMVVHMYGIPCDMPAIKQFCDAHQLKLIEDCAQAHGAVVGGKQIGTWGDCGAFSYYPTKNLGAMGDAGAIACSDPEIARRLRCLRNYGSAQKYVNQTLGYNSRLDEMQAAILRVKLEHLETMNSHKKALAELYHTQLDGRFEKLTPWAHAHSVYHIYPILTNNRAAVRQYLLDHQIKTEVHYPIPPHKQEALLTHVQGVYPVTEQIHERILSLPLSYGHTEAEILHVIEVLNKCEAA